MPSSETTRRNYRGPCPPARSEARAYARHAKRNAVQKQPREFGTGHAATPSLLERLCRMNWAARSMVLSVVRPSRRRSTKVLSPTARRPKVVALILRSGRNASIWASRSV